MKKKKERQTERAGEKEEKEKEGEKLLRGEEKASKAN